MTAASSSYLRQVTDALWDADRLGLSARQLGALENVVRISSDHSLHRRAWGKCLICDSFQRLEKATADVGTDR